jgi:hypothetical protein
MEPTQSTPERQYYTRRVVCSSSGNSLKNVDLQTIPTKASKFTSRPLSDSTEKITKFCIRSVSFPNLAPYWDVTRPPALIVEVILNSTGEQYALYAINLCRFFTTMENMVHWLTQKKTGTYEAMSAEEKALNPWVGDCTVLLKGTEIRNSNNYNSLFLQYDCPVDTATINSIISTGTGDTNLIGIMRPNSSVITTSSFSSSIGGDLNYGDVAVGEKKLVFICKSSIYSFKFHTPESMQIMNPSNLLALPLALQYQSNFSTFGQGTLDTNASISMQQLPSGIGGVAVNVSNNWLDLDCAQGIFGFTKPVLLTSVGTNHQLPMEYSFNLQNRPTFYLCSQRMTAVTRALRPLAAPVKQCLAAIPVGGTYQTQVILNFDKPTIFLCTDDEQLGDIDFVLCYENGNVVPLGASSLVVELEVELIDPKVGVRMQMQDGINLAVFNSASTSNLLGYKRQRF